MKGLKRILIALAALFVIAVVVPFFISPNDYIPQIENEVSARPKEPVSINSIRFAILPLPHVTVDGITVGIADDIRIGKVLVAPDLFSLLQSTRVIKSIEIDSLIPMHKAIDEIPVWIKSDAAKPTQPPKVRVGSIRLNSALVKFGKARLGPFDAHISLDSKGRPDDGSISTRNGKLKALIKPDGSNYLIDASAKAWALPIGPAIVFDDLSIKGVATFNDANLGPLSAKLYGGTANGKATVRWQNGLQLKGNFELRQVSLQELASTLSPSAHVSGKLSAKPVFSASAESADQLTNGLWLETL